MGNIWSLDIEIELYKWSSAEYPEEYALVYSSVNDKSKFSIFRMSVREEKVLLRFADCLCDDHPIRVNMELIAERDNYGYFNYRLVRVVEAGTGYNSFIYRDDLITLLFHKGGSLSSVMTPKRTWKVVNSHFLGFRKEVHFDVNIECHELNGLSVKFRGPFKDSIRRSVIESFPERYTPDYQREVHGEPPKHMKAFVESAFTGIEYILFRGEGRGCGGTEASVQGTNVTVSNSGGHFPGNGNGSRYQNCYVVMNYKAPNATN